MLISIGALGTDIMLPALDRMSSDLGASANDAHYIITAFFLGMGLGQLIVGPLSDAYGRKPIILAGYAVFGIGCAISMIASSFEAMLAARALQGLGASAPRIVTLALVRDGYKGAAMARIMSLVLGAFILVPIIAPILGQALLILGDWPLLFAALIFLALVISVWFAFGQPETLTAENRRAFRLGTLAKGVIEVIRTRVAFGYTLATGLIYGAFVGYLGTSQQVYVVTFGVGTLFPIYFAAAACAVGAASILNARLVMRFGMARLTWIAVLVLSSLSFAFWGLLFFLGDDVSLGVFIVWQIPTFACIGLIFANLNALALEPLGHMAGLGAAFTGAGATFLSLPLGSWIAGSFDGTAVPLVAGFAILGLGSAIIMYWTEARRT